jgi:hypothetical protein
MSQRVTKEDRILIRRDHRSIRAIAEAFDISPTTVLRIKKSDNLYDKPRNPVGYPQFDRFEETIFFEFLRLSRYHYNKLIEYLVPIWPHLPSQANQEAGQHGAMTNAVTGKFAYRFVCHKTIYSHLKRYAWGKLLKSYDKGEPPPGAIAIHRILIRWTDKKNTAEDREVLLLMDRATGLSYAKSYKRVRMRDVTSCLDRFKSMYGNDIQSFHFVTQTKARDNLTDDPSFTSVLNLERSKQDPKRPSNKSARLLMPKGNFNFSLYADKNTPSQEKRVTIPGTFANHHELNQTIAKYVNAINLTDRHYYYQDSRVEMMPLNKLIKYHQSKGEKVSEKLTTKRVTLRTVTNQKLSRAYCED